MTALFQKLFKSIKSNTNYSKHLKFAPVLLLLTATFFLRILDLGYSDYISDEPGTFFYRGGKKNPEMSKTEFILSQRKGPMQLFVGYIPYCVVGNYKNEFAQRLPFALFGVTSIIIFYLLIRKVTKNAWVAFISAFLLLVNGLITAYGRIAQYQNLVEFFTFLSLYFYADLLDARNNKLIRSSLFGTVFFCLAFLSHWYAVFLYIPVSIIVFSFLRNANSTRKYKIKLLAVNVTTAALLLLPFVLPYINYFVSNTRNIDYADRIFGWGRSFLERPDYKQFRLYSPFFVGEFYLVGVIIFIGKFIADLIRKRVIPLVRWIFLIWFLGAFLIFRFFVSYSGLHFYHIFFPVVVLCAYAVNDIKSVIPKYLHSGFVGCILLLLTFFYYQTYLLFVDHSVEYPWEQENILFWKTRKYSQEDDLRHKTGFPHKRYWAQINAYVNEQNKINGVVRGYISNEDKALTKFYMEAPNDRTESYYAIGIKRPYSFEVDYKFSQINKKKTVYSIQSESGESVVRIFLIGGTVGGGGE